MRAHSSQFHFPCNKGEDEFIFSLERATSTQNPRNLLKVAYHSVSSLFHHYTQNIIIDLFLAH